MPPLFMPSCQGLWNCKILDTKHLLQTDPSKSNLTKDERYYSLKHNSISSFFQRKGLQPLGGGKRYTVLSRAESKFWKEWKKKHKPPTLQWWEAKRVRKKNTLNWHSYFHHIKSAICSWHSLLSLGRFSQFRHGDEERWRINQINSQFGKFRLRSFSSISIPSFLPAPPPHSNCSKKSCNGMIRHVYGVVFSHLHGHNKLNTLGIKQHKGDRHRTKTL